MWNATTAVLATVAGVSNLTVAWYLWRAPVRAAAWVIWHTTAGIGGLLYAAAFAQLVFDTDLDRGAWSERLTPGSALTFFTIWTLPALIHLVDRPARDV